MLNHRLAEIQRITI